PGEGRMASGFESESRSRRGTLRTDLERDRAPETCHIPRFASAKENAIAMIFRRRGIAAVMKPGSAGEHPRDFSVDHFEFSVNHRLSGFSFPDRHPVDEDRPAIRRFEDRFENMSALEIALLGTELSLRHELKTSALTIVEDRPEMAGRIDV